MLCLKWFNTSLIVKTKKLLGYEQLEGPIMNMPDLVMRKIMENVDFITMLKLRKVCHAFRNFIDETKLDNDLVQVNINVRPSAIYATIYFNSQYEQSVNFYYIRYGNNCLLKVTEGGNEEAKFIKNLDPADAFFNDFGVILRNQSKPLENMKIEKWSYDWYTGEHYDLDVINSLQASSSIYGWCTSSRPLEDFYEIHDHLSKINDKYAMQPIADKFHDCFDCILKSRESLIPIQTLEIEVSRPSYFLNMVRLIDVKQLEGIVISKAYEKKNEEDGKQLDLNEIVELDVFKYIQKLNISDFKVSVPLETFLHIPNLRVSVSTITIEDILLIKKNMITSPTARSRRVYYDHIKDEDTITNTLGHANPDNIKLHWYFKLPESDQTLQISKENYDSCFSFTWTKTVWIPKYAVVY
ncbi:hypothetical protein GCK72_011459 [Caenorhabditis remanei]|uniref:F-box domain-containing protein n=1 Tax=Caenorhabditis remanei TaxID=31234 RepID=A0A6A5H7V9_CAERE|nr:hypothetical protein GCK72_011216 [Caenorhabditis remanei]XP_053588041.1 hypothetical protein GCK72_011459 [Caenorhabditis remanei]KAF1762951.1 hypothetical protein GCK72_011216 [Caenorhabditis remanei]KAF1763193.1 hypothetical protein GCK72_011459 [Caenorhabditis remanei]